MGGAVRPPTPPTLILKGDSLDSKAKLLLIVLVPFLWDMEDMYGASRQFSKAVDTIKLDDSI